MDLVLNELKIKINKKVYFKYQDFCKIGVLVGLISTNQYYWIIKDTDFIYVPISNSISLL